MELGELSEPPCLPVCASLTSRPMTVVFGLGTRQRVRMRRRLENGVLRNGSSLAVLWTSLLTVAR